MKMRILLMLVVGVLLAPPAFADWQSYLQANIPNQVLVETFDNLQDWNSSGVGPNFYQWCGQSGSSTTCPKNLNGTASAWEMYTNKKPTFQITQSAGAPFATGDQITGDSSGQTCTAALIWNVDGKTFFQPTVAAYVPCSSLIPGETIRTTGSTKVGTMVAWPTYISQNSHSWSGKSLTENVGDNDDDDLAMSGLGAQRISRFFGTYGDSSSGYSHIHIFLMNKFAPTFFGTGTTPNENGESIYKFMDVCSGFTNAYSWGSAAEQAKVSSWGGSGDTTYGLNFTIIDWGGPGNTFPFLYHSYNGFYPTTSNGGSTWNESQPYGPPTYQDTDVSINAPYAANDWFAYEISLNIGTMGNADGGYEVWVYDKTGNVIGHHVRTGMQMLAGFNHKYNYLALGGNRRYAVNATSRDYRNWIDDVIVTGSNTGDPGQIGPTYFALYNGPNGPGTGGNGGTTQPPLLPGCALAKGVLKCRFQ